MDVINPLAAIEAGRMMLKYLGEDEAAKAIQEAVADTTIKIDSLGAGKMGFSTSEVGDLVAGHIAGK
jgi:3-isopropylmalate dehydrogenase